MTGATENEEGGLWRFLAGAFGVRFAGGALGRIASIGIGGGALVVALGAVLSFFNAWFGLVALVGLFAVIFTTLFLARDYALRYPQYAALGDAEMERVMIHDQAARGLDRSQLPATIELPVENPMLIDHASAGDKG